MLGSVLLWQCESHLIFPVATGVDYRARKAYNKLLEVKVMDGDSSLREGDYLRCRWPETDIWPKGGWVTAPRMEGPQICTGLVQYQHFYLCHRGWGQEHGVIWQLGLHFAPVTETIGVQGWGWMIDYLPIIISLSCVNYVAKNSVVLH